MDSDVSVSMDSSFFVIKSFSLNGRLSGVLVLDGAAVGILHEMSSVARETDAMSSVSLIFLHSCFLVWLLPLMLRVKVVVR